MISSIHEQILRMVGAFMDMSLLFVTVAWCNVKQNSVSFEISKQDEFKVEILFIIYSNMTLTWVELGYVK